MADEKPAEENKEEDNAPKHNLEDDKKTPHTPETLDPHKFGRPA